MKRRSMTTGPEFGFPLLAIRDFDRTRIAKIKLGFYWQGNYAVDDLAFVGGYSDGIPQMNGNLVTNGSFEDDGSAVPVATGWNFEGGTPSATYLEKMLMYGREAQSKTRIASPATIPKSGERNRKIHSCMLYLISI